MEQRVRLYECMYILDPGLEPETAETTVKSLHDVIAEFGGTVQNDYDWGIRRFAYNIRNWSEGNYHLMYFEGTGTTADGFKKHCYMETRVIRTMIVVADPVTMYKPRVEEVEAEEEPQAPAEEAEAGEAAEAAEEQVRAEE